MAKYRKRIHNLNTKNKSTIQYWIDRDFQDAELHKNAFDKVIYPLGHQQTFPWLSYALRACQLLMSVCQPAEPLGQYSLKPSF